MKLTTLTLLLAATATPALAQHEHHQMPPANEPVAEEQPASTEEPHQGHQMPHGEMMPAQPSPGDQEMPGREGHDMAQEGRKAPGHEMPAHEDRQVAGHGAHNMSDMDHDMSDMGHDMSDMDHDMSGHEEHDIPAHEGHHMPGMAMPHDNGSPAADPPPPPRAFEGPEHAADLIWGEAAMAPAREEVAAANGEFTTAMVMAERLEARLGEHDAYLWDVQGWYGGDLDKLWLKSEGEGEFGDDLEEVEVQALWSHAIGPYFDLQLGGRYDFEPLSRSYLVAGIQGLAPYMFHVDAAAFLSDEGDLTARIEGEYDQRITQRLILQPRAELELSVQDVPELGLGSGLTSVEAGLRLRYEFAREFAPYIGVGWESAIGDTADFKRDEGEDVSGAALLLGIRAWF